MTMWTKIWTIAQKDIVSTFGDRNLMLIMIVTPLALSTIIALAFSDLGGGGAPIENIPVALVNLDEGTEDGFNAGAIFVSALVPGTSGAAEDAGQAAFTTCEATQATSDTGTDAEGSEDENYLFRLTATTEVADAATAREGVDNGDYAAAIIIPADFSQSLNYSQQDQTFDETTVEVYGSSGRPISASVIRSVTESLTNSVLTGQVAVASTIDTMIARSQSQPQFALQFLAASNSGEFQPDFSCAFDPAFNTLAINQQSVSAGEEPSLLVTFGSSMATFFALFTAAGGAVSLLEERKQWTLQRLIVSPTPRIVVMTGKLIGVLATVLLQLVFLFIALNFINALLEGEFVVIWGTNWLAIVLLLLVTSLATAGVGMFAVSLSKTTEQANVISGIVALLMGVLGGAFFQIEGIPDNIEPITRISVVRWGSEAFQKLAIGQTDILLNVVFLSVIGLVLFLSSLMIFNRRQDI